MWCNPTRTAISVAAILCQAILFPFSQTFGMLWFISKYEKELKGICVKHSNAEQCQAAICSVFAGLN